MRQTKVLPSAPRTRARRAPSTTKWRQTSVAFVSFYATLLKCRLKWRQKKGDRRRRTRTTRNRCLVRQLFGVVHAPNNNKKKEKRERRRRRRGRGGRRRKKEEEEEGEKEGEEEGKRKKRREEEEEEGRKKKGTLARKPVKKTGKGHGGFNSIPHFILE